MRRTSGFDNLRKSSPVRCDIWDGGSPAFLLSYGHLGPKDYLESVEGAVDASEISSNMAMVIAVNKLAEKENISIKDAEDKFFADGSKKFIIGAKLAQIFGDDEAQPWIRKLFDSTEDVTSEMSRANLFYRNRCVYGLVVAEDCEESPMVEVTPPGMFTLDPGDRIRTMNGMALEVAKELPDNGAALYLTKPVSLHAGDELFVLTPGSNQILIGDPAWPLDYALLDNEIEKILIFYRREAMADPPTQADTEAAIQSSETTLKSSEVQASTNGAKKAKKPESTGSKSISDSNISAVGSPNSSAGKVLKSVPAA